MIRRYAIRVMRDIKWEGEFPWSSQTKMLRYNIPNQVSSVGISLHLHFMTKPTISLVKLLFECWYTLRDKTYHNSIGSLIIATLLEHNIPSQVVVHLK